MRLLIDENVPVQVVAVLQAAGHDVLAVEYQAPGADDPSLLELAAPEQRLFITLDKDFGDLVFRDGLPAAAGVLLVRVRGTPASELGSLISRALRARAQWAGTFIVLERGRLRLAGQHENRD